MNTEEEMRFRCLVQAQQLYLHAKPVILEEDESITESIIGCAEDLYNWVSPPVPHIPPEDFAQFAPTKEEVVTNPELALEMAKTFHESEIGQALREDGVDPQANAGSEENTNAEGGEKEPPAKDPSVLYKSWLSNPPGESFDIKEFAYPELFEHLHKRLAEVCIAKNGAVKKENYSGAALWRAIEKELLEVIDFIS